jgi:hypothetical protein
LIALFDSNNDGLSAQKRKEDLTEVLMRLPPEEAIPQLLIGCTGKIPDHYERPGILDALSALRALKKANQLTRAGLETLVGLDPTSRAALVNRIASANGASLSREDLRLFNTERPLPEPIPSAPPIRPGELGLFGGERNAPSTVSVEPPHYPVGFSFIG